MNHENQPTDHTQKPTKLIHISTTNLRFAYKFNANDN